jgi:hypothetical protein
MDLVFLLFRKLPLWFFHDQQSCSDMLFFDFFDSLVESGIKSPASSWKVKFKSEKERVSTKYHEGSFASREVSFSMISNGFI